VGKRRWRSGPSHIDGAKRARLELSACERGTGIPIRFGDEVLIACRPVEGGESPSKAVRTSLHIGLVPSRRTLLVELAETRNSSGSQLSVGRSGTRETFGSFEALGLVDNQPTIIVQLILTFFVATVVYEAVGVHCVAQVVETQRHESGECESGAKVENHGCRCYCCRRC